MSYIKNKHIWVRQGQKSYSEVQRFPFSKAVALIMIWFLQIKSSLLQCDKTEYINVTRGFNAEVITGHLFKFCYQLLLRWDCLISKHKTKDRVSPYMTSQHHLTVWVWGSILPSELKGYLWHRFNKMLDQKIWSIFITQQICQPCMHDGNLLFYFLPKVSLSLDLWP